MLIVTINIVLPSRAFGTSRLPYSPAENVRPTYPHDVTLLKCSMFLDV